MDTIRMPITLPRVMRDRMRKEADKRHQTLAEYIRSSIMERWDREARGQ